MGMVVLLILAAILGIVLIPFIGFFLGWGLGWVLNLIIGSWIIDGLSLFGLNISPEMIPLFFAIVGLIASFFGASSTIKNIGNKKE